MINVNYLTLPQTPGPDFKTTDAFNGRKVILFGLPGAFTPTCSLKQLPTFDAMHSQFKEKGIEDIYCVSVNDGFVMNAWFRKQEVKNVKYIADGSGQLTKQLGMLVSKDNIGFGKRSWRYAAVINNGIVETMFAEEGIEDNHGEDPYVVSTPENVYEEL